MRKALHTGYTADDTAESIFCRSLNLRNSRITRPSRSSRSSFALGSTEPVACEEIACTHEQTYIADTQIQKWPTHTYKDRLPLTQTWHACTTLHTQAHNGERRREVGRVWGEKGGSQETIE